MRCPDCETEMITLTKRFSPINGGHKYMGVKLMCIKCFIVNDHWCFSVPWAEEGPREGEYSCLMNCRY